MAWLRKLFGTLSPDRVARRIDDEVDFHLDMRARELIAQGVPPDEARRRVEHRFGNRTSAREQARDADVLGWLDGLLRDVRSSARSLLRSPVYAAATILVLALGIGANTAVFGVIQSVLLKPFPFPDSRQIAMLMTTDSKGAPDYVTYQDLEDWRRQTHTFSSLTGWVSQTANLTGEGEPERVRAGFVTSNFFQTFGVAPWKGRDLSPPDDVPGAARVALLSNGLWQNRYGGKEDILGRKLILNNQPYIVAGILPPGFEFPWDKIDVWLPIVSWTNFSNSRTDSCCVVFGRIKPGLGLEQAQAEMTTIASQLERQYPGTNKLRRVQVSRFQDFLVRSIRPAMLILMAAVALVFLIACANVANLTLARAMSRERELAVRAALGASRGQLLRHLVSETLLLCGAGCALGLALGYAGLQFLVAARRDDLPVGVEVSLSSTALLFSVAISAGAALLVSLAPAWRILRGSLAGAREGERGSSHGPGRATLRRVLMIAEVALSLVLLAGAGLLMKSFQHVSGIDPGFRPDHLLTMEYRMPANKYPKPQQQAEFHRRVAEQTSALPGVQSATVVMGLPFSGNGSGGSIILLDRTEPEKGKEPRVEINRADPRYFATMEIPLREGRVFNEHDVLQAPPVIVINQSMARHWWPNESPVGRQLRIPGPQARPLTIVGVVGDTRHNSLETPQSDQVYLAFAQAPNIFGTLVVRTSGDPLAMTAAVRSAVWSVDKDQPVWKIRTQESLLDRYVSYRKFLAALLSGFSAFALLLAALGIYALSSYWVQQRTREIGVRVALGARPDDILRLVLGQGFRMTAAGLVLGTLAALGLTTLLRSQLSGVEHDDPATYLIVSSLLASVALVASFLPARRAASQDPVAALRANV